MEDKDQLTDEEIAARMERALKKSLTMKPEPQKKIKANAKAKRRLSSS